MGLALGQGYANTGNWHTQFNQYGTSHVITRWCKASGDTGNNVNSASIFLHDSHPFTISSAGNLRIRSQDTTRMCFTSTEVCVENALTSTGTITAHGRLCSNEWVRAHCGFYSATNNLCFRSNTRTTYGALEICGQKGGWGGVTICDTTYMARSGSENPGSDGGIYNDYNDRWILYYNLATYTRLYYAGLNKFATTNTGTCTSGLHFASSEVCSPIVCATSCVHTSMLCGIDGLVATGSATSDYGAMTIYGAKNGWGGLHTCGVSFMANDTAGGVYDDTNNSWMFYGILNGETRMYHDGTHKICTTSDGACIAGHLRAAVFVYATSCLTSPIVCSTSYHSGCGMLLTSTGNNVTGGGCDAVLWIENATSNDIGIVVNKPSHDWGMDVRLASNSLYGYRAQFGGSTKFIVSYNCMCHSVLVQSPIVCATTSFKHARSDTGTTAPPAGIHMENTHASGIFEPSIRFESSGTNTNGWFTDIFTTQGATVFFGTCNTSAYYTLHKFEYNGTACHGGDVVAYASDCRMKCNIITITCAVDRVKALRGVEFEWDKDYICRCNLHFFPTETEKTTGFLAQELENTLPTAVREAPFEGSMCREVSWSEKYKTVKAD